jgi:NAD(P)-dependent dehydrogenase (short-subunit alcohol dehydrogenase family)
MDLKGKVAVVTGGAAGIGRAYCEELVKQGCKVIHILTSTINNYKNNKIGTNKSP